MTGINYESARAEQIAMNARQIEIAILRLIRRLDPGEIAACGLADGAKVFAGLGRTLRCRSATGAVRGGRKRPRRRVAANESAIVVR